MKVLSPKDPERMHTLKVMQSGERRRHPRRCPRSANKYISSFIGFAPADDPQVLGMCVIDNPKGIYYGGTIAAPVIGNIFENIFPYLGIEKEQEMQYTREG